jgi:dienelactone hydrolase
VGFAEGVPMAMLYAMLRPDLVAAVGLYAGVPTGLQWSCEGAAPPTLVLYRSCDAVVPCEDVEAWLEGWRDRGNAAIGMRLGAGQAAETHCELDRKCRGAKGEASHRRWPKGRELDLLEFLARHSMQEGP